MNLNELDSVPLTKRWQIHGFNESAWRKVFTLALWNLSVEIYQLKEKHIFNDTKVLWKGNPENCVRNSSPQRRMYEERLKAYKLCLEFKDCRLLVKTFLIGIKVSSRNWASETFSDFHYLLWNVQWSLTSLHFQCWMKTKLIVFKPTVLRVWLVRLNRIVWSFYANKFLTYNFGYFHFLLAV